MEKEPIRILHVVGDMSIAGAETLLMCLYRKMDRTLVQFDFAVGTTEEKPYDREILAMGGRIIPYPKYTGKNHFSYCRWWKRFFTEHREYRIIHGHIEGSAAFYLGIAKKAGLYTIAHSHNTNGPLRPREILFRLFTFPTRYIAHHFLGCSKDALLDRYGKRIASNPLRAEVLKNGIETQRFSYDEKARTEVRSEFGISDDTILGGTIGRLTYQKNPKFILSLVDQARRDIPSFRFLWVGIGEEEDNIRKEISERGLENTIIMAGLRRDANRIYQALDCFIFPSHFEGLGIVAIEAQTSGLTTLCSNAVPREAKITENCRFLSTDDTSLWIKAIAETRALARKSCVQDTIDKGYDIESVASRLQNFYLGIH